MKTIRLEVSNAVAKYFGDDLRKISQGLLNDALQSIIEQEKDDH